MNTILFSTGSNIGNRPSHLKYALKMLEKRIGKVVSKSDVYISEAWGETEQRDFLNQVIEVETELGAIECLDIIQNIEKERLRTRKKHWGPRTLDIDILFYNQEKINSHRLIIPHPFLAKRLFVLLPLSEILPDFIHPVSKKSISTLLSNCEDKSKLTKYLNGT